MNHPHILDPILSALRNLHGNQPYWLSCLGLALTVAVLRVIGSIIRLSRYPAPPVEPEAVQYAEWEMYS